MSKLQVFDPAMCCSAGVCGPSVDPVLPRFSADLEWLKSKGVQVERFNLAQEIAAFTANSVVKAAINSKGTECLPMVLVDGDVVSEGAYPTREQLASFTGVAFEPGPVFKRRPPDLVGIGHIKSGAEK
jgi:arsenite methyltransferase